MINKYLKIAAFCLLAVLVVIGGKKVYNSRTDGFFLGNILASPPYNPEWNVRPLNVDENVLVDEALSQPYHYLGKGHQCYAFESEDGKYVIKFLKAHKLRIHPFVAWIPVSTKKIEHKQKKRDAAFNSWQIAFEDLKDQTEVLYVHINKSENLNKVMRAYNKAGWEYDIDLDTHVFLLQHKSGTFSDAMQNFVQKQDLTGAKTLLDSLLAMYIYEYKSGLQEKDHYIVRNTGVYNGKPIHIDVGRFERDESIKNPEVYSKELLWKTKTLKKWLERNYPELSVYFNEKLNFNHTDQL